MRAFRVAALVAFLVAAWSEVRAQSGQPPAQPNVIFLRPPLQDGGTREVLESIVIPPMVDAPFTLTLHTEWVRAFADGGSQTFVNHRRIARDGNGRIYQERQGLMPKGGDEASILTFIQIADPSLHQLYTCSFANRICELTLYTAKPLHSYQPPLAPVGRPKGSAREVTRDDLGINMILGIEANGTRETTTVDAGAAGNDRPMVSTREFWFSPKLGISLISKRSDPRFGSQTFVVSDIEESEPDAILFQPPQGFQIKDLRKLAAPSD